MIVNRRGSSAAAMACALSFASAASAQQMIVVASGTTDTAAKVVSGTDSITVEQGGTLSVAANPAISWNNASSGIVIVNSGTIRSTSGSGRAINASGGDNSRSVTLTNNAGAVIESADDAFRINVDPSGGTIIVNNAGTIRTTNGGQALDFDAAGSGAATITINNLAGGTLSSVGQDAIRPGQGAIMNNAGTIVSDGPPNNSYDGVDWQGNSGMVNNQAGGTISGLRHGITSDVDVDVANAGTILGRNGSGVGSDGVGTVVNLAGGTITGQWDGVAINGDGDGVDIDGAGSVTNAGTIQGLSAHGVDSGGQPNNAEGIAMGGGTIVNTAGATIFGAGSGILVDDGSAGPGVAATNITNAGTIRGGTGAAISLVGGFDDRIRNSGTIEAGSGGIAISMGGGNDTLDIDSGSVITGSVDGGAGNDEVRLGPDSGTGGSFAGSTSFETLNVLTGPWALTGPQAYANGIRVTQGASISGSAATLAQSAIDNAGLVTIDAPTDTTFAGTVTGEGAVSKTGAGNLSLGAQGFTGGLNVESGTLTLTGSQAATSYSINVGATLTSGASTTIGSTARTLAVTNAGTIVNTREGGRAINVSGAGEHILTLGNAAGALIQSADDAIRINVDPTSVNVRVDNAGTIRTTDGGQAIDFDAVETAGTIEIINRDTGVIQSFGQDAIRPGQGAVVQNAGLIFSDGPANNNYDGVDWQGKAGTVLNQATGTISGLRHGITSDVAVDVLNNGTIIGRNGSGVGSDGTGRVVNMGGTITGQWDGVATNGDGDGVDIDGAGTIMNTGTIQGLSAHGVDSGGQPNSAEGIAMGGGTIVNDGIIFGAGAGILIDDGSAGPGVAATTIDNSGTIRGGTGAAIRLVGDFDDAITNSGTITGGSGGIAIDMGGGNDTLSLLTSSLITGAVDGGAGTDSIVLGGSGLGAFAGAVDFETLDVQSGGWTLVGGLAFANGTTIEAGASLSGNAALLSGAIADDGTLVVNQGSDATFAAALSGGGALIKDGAGALTIGDQSFTGTTSVAAGKLIVAGSFPSAVTVRSGATLGGAGTVAALTIENGGTVAPGNSPGTLAVTGDFVQAAGSTYAAETTAAGVSDRIVVGGSASIASGARLSVGRDSGTYAVGTRYTLLTATDGVSGAYTLDQPAPGAIEFRLGGSADSVFVDVARSATGLVSIAQTPNQRAVAPALAALGLGNAAYAALTLDPSDARVREAFDDLSGEVHASLHNAMLKDAQLAEGAVLDRLDGRGAESAVWGQIVGRDGEDDGTSGTANVDRNTFGGIGGVDVALGDTVRVGLAGGYTRTKLSIAARESRARVESTHLLAYAGGSLGAATVRAGIGYAWTDNRTNRSIASAGFSDATRARYDGDVLHGFGEIGYDIPFGGGTVSPFARIEGYRVHTDGFAETGGVAALAGAAQRENVAFSTLGFKAETPLVETVSARARVGWQHGFNDLRPDAQVRFAGGTMPFDVIGAGLSRDAATAALDLAWRPTAAVTVTTGYSGWIGGQGDDSSFRIGLAIAF